VNHIKLRDIKHTTGERRYYLNNFFPASLKKVSCFKTSLIVSLCLSEVDPGEGGPFSSETSGCGCPFNDSIKRGIPFASRTFGVVGVVGFVISSFHIFPASLWIRQLRPRCSACRICQRPLPSGVESFRMRNLWSRYSENVRSKRSKSKSVCIRCPVPWDRKVESLNSAQAPINKSRIETLQHSGHLVGSLIFG
jgi:hypothetical protein